MRTATARARSHGSAGGEGDEPRLRTFYFAARRARLAPVAEPVFLLQAMVFLSLDAGEGAHRLIIYMGSRGPHCEERALRRDARIPGRPRVG